MSEEGEREKEKRIKKSDEEIARNKKDALERLFGKKQ